MRNYRIENLSNGKKSFLRKMRRLPHFYDWNLTSRKVNECKRTLPISLCREFSRVSRLLIFKRSSSKVVNTFSLWRWDFLLPSSDVPVCSFQWQRREREEFAFSCLYDHCIERTLSSEELKDYLHSFRSFTTLVFSICSSTRFTQAQGTCETRKRKRLFWLLRLLWKVWLPPSPLHSFLLYTLYAGGIVRRKKYRSCHQLLLLLHSSWDGNEACKNKVVKV